MPKNIRRFGPLALMLVAGAAPLHAQNGADTTPHGRMMRFPDVSKDHVCFVYANDIWVAPKRGGVAAPLASPPGVEGFPKFSLDGKTIAFNGNYDGNRDIYTIPVDGGIPVRVTHHPAGESLADWTPDGGLMFVTNGFAGLTRQSQLWRTGAAGGLPSKLPVPYSGFGAVSPNGEWLAYTPHSTDTRTWKRYRGGMATDLWLFNLKTNQSKRATDWEGTDTLPMWVPGGDNSKVYFLSDAGKEHRLNVWSYDVRSGAKAQVTGFDQDDVRWPSIGPGDRGEGEIVFQLGARMMLLNLGSGRSEAITITVPGARPKLRDTPVDASKNVGAAAPSPTGKRVVLEARGDLWTAPAKEGPVRNFTRTDGVAERDPAWSPDGRWIAYFSDETGEYQLWVRPSDAKPPEKKDDKDKKDGDAEKKEGEKAEAPAAAEPRPAPAAPRKLTNLGPGFRFNPQWSPDSKMIAFTDENGRLYLANVEDGSTREIDKDPWMNGVSVSWSSDSRWIAYSRAEEGNGNGAIRITDAKTGEKHRVTSGMFNDNSPAFDRKGDFLFFRSQRDIDSPLYSDVDTTFVYTGTDTLLMTPLRRDVKNPWLPKSDEETLKEEKEEKKDGAKKDEGGKEKKDGEKSSDAASDDPISGTWDAESKFNDPQPNRPAEIAFTLKLTLKGDDVSGTVTSPMGSGDVSGTFDKESGELRISLKVGEQSVNLTGKVVGEKVEGTWTAGDQDGTWSASRAAKGGGGGDEKSDDKKDEKDDKAKEVKIDFDGFERRAMTIPVTSGSFGPIAVADGEKLLFVRYGARGKDEPAQVKVYNYADADEREEKKVADGGNFQLSGDGKKILVLRGGKDLSIVDASAGGKSQSVPTAGMTVMISPREEWRQIFNDAWRIMRDYFYEPTMHGVDWAKMREHYGAMLADAATREDVNWVIAEMISELNVGHAYLGNPGDVEQQPTVGVGMLGCDFELVGEGDGRAYRIRKIYEGGVWDADARGPLSQPGVDVKEGDYLLAVDGVPIDTSKDPWAAFVGAANRAVTITVSDKPVMDGTERSVVVRPDGSETTLRYRAWIERKRRYVDEKSGGTIGYIYVPNTGVDGQDNLFRQFIGQRDKAGLIIDERWNGGGQIPTRFIELLNRPVTNYWARRDGIDWTWPPDSHQGAKVMLANGLAGSGGDMFPWLFKHNKIGPVIGTRTWGGLVGISGNPGFIDGGSITVPTFGFYETDGTWGVEGHGVDPDIEVIDDPAMMYDTTSDPMGGGDPQLDRAIAEVDRINRERPYARPARPKSPNRAGMGLDPRDR
ncbi:MAG TPA: PDZ domain-containing protein [Phycisphaerales bacterium]|nr:PDZ domain-containing protein [Phycisphaerales bacterium]